MVHALQETWRVLVPGGHLIDLRPRATNWPLEVVADGQVRLAGKVDNAPFVPDDTAADWAIKRMVREGRFMLEHQASFDCASYWDTLEDMLTYYSEDDSPPLTIPDNVLATTREFTATATQSSKVRIRMSIDLSRYYKLAPQMNN